MNEERIWIVNDEKLKEMVQDFFPASVFDTESLFCIFAIALKEKKIQKTRKYDRRKLRANTTITFLFILLFFLRQ